MRNPLVASLDPKNAFRFLMLAIVICALGAMTMLSAAPAPTISVSIANNSSLEIRHLYLSPADNDNWGADQLSGAINPGATVTLNVSWNQATVKIVTEDQDGCFVSNTVDATVDSSVSITNNSPRNCGG